MKHISTNFSKDVKLNSARIVLIYVVVSFLWIILSDRAVGLLTEYYSTFVWINTFKGWVFVIVTAVMLFVLQKSYFSTILKAEQITKQCELRNQAFLAAIPDAIFHVDEQGIVLDFKAAADEKSSFSSAENLIGKPLWEFMPQSVAVSLTKAIFTALASGEVQTEEYELESDGTVTHWEARVAICGSSEALVIVRNITERKKLLEELKYLSLYDALTGLYNRAYFEQELIRLQGNRYAPVGVIICDVDDLKIVNDSIGHDGGDALIKAAAAVLQKAFRTSDVIARIGGDEFAVLMPHSQREVVEAACSRIRELEMEYNATHPRLQISMSVGFAVSDEKFADMTSLVKQADNRMYTAKFNRKSVQSFHDLA